MRKLLFFSSLVFFTNTTFSQTVEKIRPLCDTCNKELLLRFESTPFFKNNEYSNSFTKGFTGIGFFVRPTTEYYLSNKTKINAGAYLLKYSGRNNFSWVSPIFSVEHLLNKKLRLVFGSIYGSLYHNLEEPLYRCDRYYQDNIENGVQLLWNSPVVESDLWLSWKTFVLKDDPFQEEFVIGNNTTVNIMRRNNIRVSLPIQLLVFHKGGQIDSSPDPVASILNGVVGLNFKCKFNNSTLGVVPLVFLYQGWGLPNSGVNSQVYNEGAAVYLKATYSHKGFYSMLGFWSADKFIAPTGEYLFQSVSEVYPGFSEDKRQLITAKMGIKKKISPSFSMEVRAEGYYDIKNSDFSHSIGLFLFIDEVFFLKTAKNKEVLLKN